MLLARECGPRGVCLPLCTALDGELGAGSSEIGRDNGRLRAIEAGVGAANGVTPAATETEAVQEAFKL